MKGVGPVGVFLLLVILGLSFEAIYLNLFIGTSVSRSIVSQEVDILRAVNKMEIVKTGLPYALEYSFSQALYDVSKNGGYIKIPDDVPKYRDLPLWREYDKVYVPDIIENVEKLTLIYLNQYISSIDSLEATYNEVSIIDEGVDTLRIEANSIQDLNISSSFYSVYENPNISISFNSGLFYLYEFAKNKFIDDDTIWKIVTNSIENFDCESDKDMIKNKIEQAIRTGGFSTEKLTLSMSCEEIVFNPDCNSIVAVIVEVNLIDNTKYIVYDGTSDYRNPQLHFFIKTSNDYSFQPI